MKILSEVRPEGLPRQPPIWRRPGYRAMERAQRTVFGRVFVDRAGDQRGTTWVIGGGRSGTTWIAEAINHRNEYRYMWEPVSPRKVADFAHFELGQYLRPDNQDRRFSEPLTAVLTGRLRHPWVDHLNCNPAATRRLVKDIHANLLARWVHVNLRGVRMLLVLRHPLAVITSRMDLAHDKAGGLIPDLDHFLRQEELMADFLAPFEALIRDARTQLEAHALRWCIEAYVPLRQFRYGDIHTVCYEQLRWHSAQEIPRLATYLGRDLGGVQSKLHRPSRTAGHGGSIERGVDPASAWTRRWPSDEVRRVMRIIAAFGLDRVYTDDPRPRPAGLQTFMEEEAA